MRGMNLILFISRYVRRDTGSLLPPDKGQEGSGCKLFFTGSLLPSDKGQEVSGCGCGLFLGGFLLPPDKGQEVNGCKLFFGGWFVCSRYGGVTWVVKL